MLVKFRNHFYGKDGKFYRQGVQEFSGQKEDLPSTATILDVQGTLPSEGFPPEPGFGAKPMQEQLRDLAGAPNPHEFIPTSDVVPTLTGDERRVKETEAAKQRAEDAKHQNETDAVKEEAEAKDAAEAAAKAVAVEEEVNKQRDPLKLFEDATPAKPVDTPKPVEPAKLEPAPKEPVKPAGLFDNKPVEDKPAETKADGKKK